MVVGMNCNGVISQALESNISLVYTKGSKSP